MAASQRTKHHRRPQARNGSGGAENIVRIDQEKHVAWHTVFNDMCAPGIEILLNAWFLAGSHHTAVLHKKREAAAVGGNPCGPTCSIMCELIGTDSEYVARGPTEKQLEAWHTLFGRKRWKRVIEEINAYYIDPAFYITLERIPAHTQHAPVL